MRTSWIVLTILWLLSPLQGLGITSNCNVCYCNLRSIRTEKRSLITFPMITCEVSPLTSSYKAVHWLTTWRTTQVEKIPSHPFIQRHESSYQVKWGVSFISTTQTLAIRLRKSHTERQQNIFRSSCWWTETLQDLFLQIS